MQGTAARFPGVSTMVLAGHPDPAVRQQAASELADSRDPSLAVLVLLSRDPDHRVRIAAARLNRFVDDGERPSLLLAEDANARAREVAGRATRSGLVLSKLARDPDAAVREAVARNQFTPADAFAVLARDGSEGVRYAVAVGGHAPDDVLAALRRDSSDRVGQAARDGLRRRGEENDDRGRIGASVHAILAFDAYDPKRVLVEMVRAAEPKARKRLAEQAWIPAEALRELAHDSYGGVRASVAANPNTPPAVLDEMCFLVDSFGSPSDGARAALVNPSTPRETLHALVTAPQIDKEYREGALANPSVPVDLSEFAAGELRKAVAANPSAPEALLRTLATDADSSVRYAVAGNPRTPQDTLSELARDSDTGSVRPAVARNPNTPPSALGSLLDHGFVRHFLAERPNLPRDISETLARDPDPGVRQRLALNPTIPSDLQDLLAEDPEIEGIRAGRRSAIDRASDRLPLPTPTTPIEAAATVIRALPVSDRRDLATWAAPWSMLGSSFVLNVLSEDPSPLVRESVAANSHTSDVLRARLARDPDEDVRRTVAWHTDSAELAAQLARDESDSVRWAAAHNLCTPSGALPGLARDRESTRKQIAQHPNAGSDLLSALAGDDEVNVRRSVAANPRAAPQTLGRLAVDPDPQVRQFVAAHPNSGAETLSRLAGDSDVLVRLVVALNQRASSRALLALAGDADASVRQAVAQNHKTPVEAWERLVSDTDAGVRSLCRATLRPPVEVRRAVAAGPGTIAATLALLASDSDLSVRRAVAGNSGAPAEALATLAADSERQIRVLVARRGDLPADALSLLARDRSWLVRRAAVSQRRRD